MAWYRNDKAVVVEALREGERPDLATTMASGPLDELVALHQELGIFAILDELEVQRTRAGVADELVLRTLACGHRGQNCQLEEGLWLAQKPLSRAGRDGAMAGPGSHGQQSAPYCPGERGIKLSSEE